MDGRRLMMLVAVAVAGMLSACDSGPADGSGADVVDGDRGDRDDAEVQPQEAADPEPAGEPAGAEPGTRTNPVPVGTTVQMGDWDLAVVDVTRDATAQVLEENQFNEEPADDHQFVMFEVEATYAGDDSGDPWLDFSWAVVGSEGNTFSDSGGDYCGTIPDPLDSTGETFPGGNVAGNVCASVASDQVEGGTIRVEEMLSLDDTRVFFAIE